MAVADSANLTIKWGKFFPKEIVFFYNRMRVASLKQIVAVLT
jgi:hypothetical protein